MQECNCEGILRGCGVGSVFVFPLCDKNKDEIAAAEAAVVLKVISIHEERKEDGPAAQIRR